MVEKTEKGGKNYQKSKNSDHIKEAIELFGIDTLSSALGVTKNSLYHWTSGKTKPPKWTEIAVEGCIRRAGKSGALEKSFFLVKVISKNEDTVKKVLIGLGCDVQKLEGMDVWFMKT